ncbi:hypothetical protein DFH09DRAFT_1472908, partial [Mycena vulgaris]
MDGTRVDIIRDIVTKLTGIPSPAQRIVMLSGSAGSGKSTIAKSVATTLAEAKMLAASFFFSRDYTERKQRTGILAAHPRLQFEKTVVERLAEMLPSSQPWVICLDALDECGNDRGQILLRWLSDTIAQIPPHVRFLLTGRPDVPSYLEFDSLRYFIQGIVLDQINPAVVRDDIHRYVGRSLDGANWTTRNPWKAQSHDVDEITNRADGLFIFAATAVRYVIAGLPLVHPQKSVDYLLKGVPLTHLHDLYHRIVDGGIAAPQTDDPRAQDSRDCIVRILGTILHLLDPLDPENLASLLGIEVDTLKRSLFQSQLSAVIRIPHAGGTIQIIHLSFREFMTSKIQETRPDLLCGTEQQQSALASDLFRVLRNGLKFNICHLPTSYLRNADVVNLDARINDHVPAHLRYACRFWGDHVAAIPFNSEIAQMAEEFLFSQFLFWLEVLSLLAIVRHAPQALTKLMKWTNSHATIEFVSDAKQFIAFFADAIVQSAPHIYLS